MPRYRSVLPELELMSSPLRKNSSVQITFILYKGVKKSFLPLRYAFAYRNWYGWP